MKNGNVKTTELYFIENCKGNNFIQYTSENFYLTKLINIKIYLLNQVINIKLTYHGDKTESPKHLLGSNHNVKIP
jgi:hypothetical protein